MADCALSVLIAARNETYLRNTVEDVLAHRRGDTEIIVVLDGAWADPQLDDDPRVTVVFKPVSIGQRAAVNLAASLARGRYVMKLDAHCAVDDGFDVVLVEDGDQLGETVTQIPRMYNLHVFDRQCRACGHLMYQGPSAVPCEQCQATAGFDKILRWLPRWSRRTDFARFDTDLHFQYWGSYDKRADAKADHADVLSSVGACFVMRRSRFVALGGLDEGHGSWGQFGTEVSCKSWLSGGRQVVNKRTWFSHLFRTQGGDFTFPYPQSGTAQDYARTYSQALWRGNRWPGQVRPLSWLIDRFAPVPVWHEPAGAPALAAIQDAGRTFVAAGRPPEPPLEPPRIPQDRRPTGPTGLPSAGLVFYTDGRLDPRLADVVRRTILRSAPGLPVSAVGLGGAPPFGDLTDGSRTRAFSGIRGALTMFRQILAGLEALDTDVAFLVEHDVLYHPDHFLFRPTNREQYFYNQHRWQVSTEDGRAVHYLCAQTSGLCADRRLLIAHYRLRLAHVEQHGFDRNLGYEPGTNRRSRELDPHGASQWFATHPNLDLRHGGNLSKTRWRVEDFRNKNSCLGWTEADPVPGWGPIRGRFWAFLEDVAVGRQPTSEGT